ncbi:hypothetical protein PHISP_04751 [Aspergillus sp. HF37]|nr:hypothetical protein PHISP_04751 [Aspergillus sp. HF37]
MEKRGPTPGSGSYGKACKQCSKAKCRCVAQPDSAACERCTRLKKQCQPPDSSRRRGFQNPESGAQVAKLEGRIDVLTTTLQSVANATGVCSDSASLTDAPSQPNPSRTSSSAKSLPSPLYELALDEASWYLGRFMNHMLPCFPFICISPGTTVEQLRRERPFLGEAIIAVATPSTQEKLDRAERLKCHLTRLTVLENQSSIDMLLGILTYITWSTDPFLQRASDLSRMIILAMSLVYDLQLGKKQPPDAQVIATIIPGLGSPERNSSDSSTQGILEQRRAVLACFVLSSIISSSFGSIVPLQWNAQMEEAVSALETKKAYPSDECFAIQVRLQVLAQRARCIREPQKADHASAAVTATKMPFATSIYVKVLQEQLRELKASFSPHLPRRDMLIGHAHYVELCISEATRLASSEDPLPPISRPDAGAGASGSTAGFEHIESLWRSLYAVKSWLDVFHAIPPSAYVGFPFFFWFQLVRCIVILKHLSTFDYPAWDTQAARDSVDMLTLLAWMAEKAELASREAGERADDDLFRRVGKMLRLSQNWVVAKQKAAAQAEEASNSLYTGGPDLGPAGEDMMDLPELEWMNALGSGDGSWLEEVLGWSPMTL